MQCQEPQYYIVIYGMFFKSHFYKKLDFEITKVWFLVSKMINFGPQMVTKWAPESFKIEVGTVKVQNRKKLGSRGRWVTLTGAKHGSIWPLGRVGEGKKQPTDKPHARSLARPWPKGPANSELIIRIFVARTPGVHFFLDSLNSL